MSTHDFKYDVFLSHSSKDKPTVREIACQLEADGLKVWFDENTIQPGDSIPAAIEEGLRQSRIVVLFLSQNSVGNQGSDHVSFERGTTFMRDPLNRDRRLIPVRLDDSELPDTLNQFAWIDARCDWKESYPRLLATCRRAEDSGELHHNYSCQQLFVMNPYTLLANDRLIGRTRDLRLLSETADGAGTNTARVICLTAVGGSGKSAVSWKWVNERSATGTDEGVIWWSFYDSGSDIDRFVTASLGYITGVNELTVRARFPAYSQREARFFELLTTRRFVIALDGLERVLNVYCRLDAAFVSDESADESDGSKDGTSNFMRRAADPRTTQFLRRLTTISANGMKSFILITTRLVPHEFEITANVLCEGVHRYDLTGMDGVDALDYWHAFGCRGMPENLLAFFGRIDGHALTIKVLASSVVRNFVTAPGDFDQWYDASDEFRVSSLQLINVRHHIFGAALQGLTRDERRVLETISAHRLELTGLQLSRICANTPDLSRLLVNLESRGLIGWNRNQNVIGLHPVVRVYVWENTADDVRNSILNRLIEIYERMTPVERQRGTLDANVDKLILFGLLIQVHRIDDAWTLYDGELRDVLWYRLGLAREQAVLLEGLFSRGLKTSLLANPYAQAASAHTLSHSIYLLGEPARSLASFSLAVAVAETNCLTGQNHLQQHYSAALRTTGNLYAAEVAIRRSIGQEDKTPKDQAFDLRAYGTCLETRGQFDHALSALTLMREKFDSLSVTDHENAAVWQAMARDYLAELLVRMGQPSIAEKMIAEADAIGTTRFSRDQVRTHRIRGSIYSTSNPDHAVGLLDEALSLAAELRFVEEQIQSLRFLAISEHQLEKYALAADHLEQAMELCLRGGYRVYQCEIEIQLALLGIATDAIDDAIDHARAAYRLAWCDGPPFAVDDVLHEAIDLLNEFDADVPVLEPIDGRSVESLPSLPKHLAGLG